MLETSSQHASVSLQRSVVERLLLASSSCALRLENFPSEYQQRGGSTALLLRWAQTNLIQTLLARLAQHNHHLSYE